MQLQIPEDSRRFLINSFTRRYNELAKGLDGLFSIYGEQPKPYGYLSFYAEDLALSLGYLRHLTSGGNEYNQELIRKDSGTLQSHVEGARAELAVASFLGIKINFEGLESPTGDSGFDLIKDGKTIDVKWMNYPTGNLLFRSPDSFKADIAILCGPGPEVGSIMIHGAVSQRRFLDECEEKELVPGKFTLAFHCNKMKVLHRPESLR